MVFIHRRNLTWREGLLGKTSKESCCLLRKTSAVHHLYLLLDETCSVSILALSVSVQHELTQEIMVEEEVDSPHHQ